MTYPWPTAAHGRVSIASVLDHVAFETGFERGDIIGASRKTHLVRSRYATAWLSRRHTGKTFAQIGRALGGRDSSTIVHEVYRAVQLRQTDKYFCWMTNHLDALLLGASGEDAPPEIADAVMQRFERMRGRPERQRDRSYRREGMTLWHRLAVARELDLAA